jgi:hypothetical protein
MRRTCRPLGVAHRCGATMVHVPPPDPEKSRRAALKRHHAPDPEQPDLFLTPEEIAEYEANRRAEEEAAPGNPYDWDRRPVRGTTRSRRGVSG